MTVAEGGGKRAVEQKLRDMYLPTLKANFMVWPLVQIINFRLMPIQFQLVSHSSWHLRKASVANYIYSHLFQLSVLHGLLISPCRMLLKIHWMFDQLPCRPTFDYCNSGTEYGDVRIGRTGVGGKLLEL